MLKPRKRITKKEIKQDKLVTIYFKVNDWLEANSKYVIVATISLVIIIAGIFLFISQQRSKEEKASANLAVSVRLLESGQYRDAIDKLNVLVDEFGSTKSGKLGRFYLANAHFELEEYGLAEEQFRKFLSKSVNDPLLISSALSGHAASLEQMGKYIGAAELYEKAARKYPKECLVSEELFNAARCYILAGEKQTAVAVLQKIIKDYPKSEEAEKAKVHLASLAQENSDISVIEVES